MSQSPKQRRQAAAKAFQESLAQLQNTLQEDSNGGIEPHPDFKALFQQPIQPKPENPKASQINVIEEAIADLEAFLNDDPDRPDLGVLLQQEGEETDGTGAT